MKNYSLEFYNFINKRFEGKKFSQGERNAFNYFKVFSQNYFSNMRSFLGGKKFIIINIELNLHSFEQINPHKRKKEERFSSLKFYYIFLSNLNNILQV